MLAILARAVRLPPCSPLVASFASFVASNAVLRCPGMSTMIRLTCTDGRCAHRDRTDDGTRNASLSAVESTVGHVITRFTRIAWSFASTEPGQNRCSPRSEQLLVFEILQ